MRLLNKNVTKAYKKTDLNVPYMITTKDKLIAEQLGLDDRIDVSAHRDSYITMKDHKPDFVNNPACRLLNPSKTEIGVISKHLLDDINSKIVQAPATSLNGLTLSPKNVSMHLSLLTFANFTHLYPRNC